MRTNDLLQAALRMSAENHSDVRKRWVDLTHRLGAQVGVAHLATLASNGRFDMMLRQLEAEALEDIQNPPARENDFTFDFMLALSESWVLRSYEVIRSACEQAQNTGEAIPDKFKVLKDRLALVRIPIAKAEIGGADRYRKINKKLPDLALFPVGDGPDNGAKDYAHDGSYVIPRGICIETGAIVWYPIDLKSQQTVDVCRRDLSDEFLALFD